MKGMDIFNQEPKPHLKRAKLRVARPISNALLFFGINDTCIQQMCGFDILFLQYIAQKLNKEIRFSYVGLV